MADDEMTAQIGDMIDFSTNGDFNKANNIFNDLMAGRIQSALDQEKVALANQVYNGADEEQLELPLEDDEDYSDEELDAAADEVADAEDLDDEDDSEEETEEN
jgi:uncharacterized protein (DUF1800 family)